MKLKIMTFNTQHCLNYRKQKIDFDIMADAIKRVDPDIVGLQEMRNTGLSPDYVDQVGILAYKTGMQGIFAEAIKFSGVNPYGVGLLSKFPIVEKSFDKIPDPVEKKYNGWYETRGILKTLIDVGEGEPVNVCVSHFGCNPDEHELAVQTALKSIPQKRTIFMGDLNMTPDNPIIQPLFNHLNDTASYFSNEKFFTYDSINPLAKIDYVFASDDFKVVSAEVPDIVASDHRPFVSVLEV